MTLKKPAPEEIHEAGLEALDILKWLDEEGDHDGRCVDKRCRSAPCLPRCRIHIVLTRAGMK